MIAGCDGHQCETGIEGVEDEEIRVRVEMGWDSRCILGNEVGIKIFLYLVSKMGTKPVYA